ncbi:polysaccharide deacetylase family protein [Vaginella massiliensis]|uniref:polysaccharide deacetylase family protein n=1 Tax=Vaginella massiliensis TaxID=1816680 RepID=UPI0012B52E71|nr:polysaccharide deacetylase family protein [Vaginella massiliensis]
MNDTLFIYAPQFTPRMHYVLEFVLVENFGLKISTSTNEEAYRNTALPKIKLAKEKLSDELVLLTDEILTENTIRAKLDYSILSPLSIIFFWLSRYEEYFATANEFDQHQRFLGSDLDYSIPQVDELVEKIRTELQTFYPNLKFKTKTFRQLNTYDVDFVWKYLHHGFKKNFLSLIKNFVSGNWQECKLQIQVLSNRKLDPYDKFQYLKTLAAQHQVESLYFWLLGKGTRYDKNLSADNRAHRRLIQEVAQYANIGIHPSYASSAEANILAAEIRELESILGKKITRSRQHFIKLHLPKTYRDLLQLAIKEDYSMGFAHRLGFRAGTSHDFWWYDLEKNQQTDLRIYPFVAMDVTLRNYLQLSPKDAILELKNLKKLVKQYHGNFVCIFHQSNFTNDWEDWKIVYESIFD